MWETGKCGPGKRRLVFFSLHRLKKDLFITSVEKGKVFVFGVIELSVSNTVVRSKLITQQGEGECLSPKVLAAGLDLPLGQFTVCIQPWGENTSH